MLAFLRSLFNPTPPSGVTAKERLRVVLLSDHLSLAPEVVAAMKRDLLEVLSRYVEIDAAHADVTFEQREREVAMLANVPITAVRERKAEVAPEPATVPEPAAVPELVAVATDVAVAEQDFAAGEHTAESVPAFAVAQAPLGDNAHAPRRRRRKKRSAVRANAVSAVPATVTQS